MRQADGDMKRKYDVKTTSISQTSSACRIQLSLSGNSVPRTVPDAAAPTGRESHVCDKAHLVLHVVGDDRDGLESQVVRGGLPHHDGRVGPHPRATARVVDMDPHADPEVGQGERIRVERTPARVLMWTRPDLDSGDRGGHAVSGVARQGDLVDGNDVAVLVSDLDDNDVFHRRLLSLPRGDCRPPRFEASYVQFSYITRDEVSTAKEKHNNTSLHQSRSHLVLTSACQ